MSKRVIAAMSGGVDSSVAAALLVEQGYDVVGVYILGWTGNDKFPCNWQKEEADARRVAELLDIPFYTVNLSEDYYKQVIEEFFEGYKKGLTPNPDILCNKEIKFKAMWQAVRQFEPDYIATGHYAKMINGLTPKATIVEPVDKNKDQTYFLWGIDKAILPKIIFPLGDMAKAEVREKAGALGLPTAAKKDSQGICFVGNLKVREFLESQISTKEGDVVLSDGKKIAEHQGVSFYTIGQRLGAGAVDWTGDVPPLYVIAKDVKRNRLIVGHDKDTFTDSLLTSDVNNLVSFEWPKQVFARVRYRQKLVECRVVKTDTGLEVEFLEPVRAVTAGQSIVFYDTKGDVLGGAIISEVPAQKEIIAKLNGRTDQDKDSK